MKARSVFLSSIVLASGFLNAEEVDVVATKPAKHRVFFGPDIQRLDYSNKRDDFTYKYQGTFFGGKVGYDFIERMSPYFGIDYSYVRRKAHQTFIFKGTEGFRTSDTTKGHLNHLEIRGGYNLAAIRGVNLTPFISFGEYHAEFEVMYDKHKLYQKRTYAGLGFKSEYALNDTICIGFDAKGSRNLRADNKFMAKKEKTNIHWSYELGLPITWIVGEEKKWDVQLHPYYLNLDTKAGVNIFGSRLLVGYRM